MHPILNYSQKFLEFLNNLATILVYPKPYVLKQFISKFRVLNHNKPHWLELLSSAVNHYQFYPTSLVAQNVEYFQNQHGLSILLVAQNVECFWNQHDWLIHRESNYSFGSTSSFQGLSNVSLTDASVLLYRFQFHREYFLIQRRLVVRCQHNLIVVLDISDQIVADKNNKIQ